MALLNNKRYIMSLSNTPKKVLPLKKRSFRDTMDEKCDLVSPSSPPPSKKRKVPQVSPESSGQDNPNRPMFRFPRPPGSHRLPDCVVQLAWHSSEAQSDDIPTRIKAFNAAVEEMVKDLDKKVADGKSKKDLYAQDAYRARPGRLRSSRVAPIPLVRRRMRHSGTHSAYVSEEG